MTLTKHPDHYARPSAEDRFGYWVSITINFILLYVVNKLPDWESPAFLSDDIDQVIPIVSLSLAASIVLGFINLSIASRALKSGGEIISAVIAMVATVRIWQVFPFDFSDYAVNWEPLTRVILVLAMVGITIAIIVQTVKLIVAVGRPRG